MFHVPYHISDNGDLAEVGRAPPLNAVTDDPFPVIAWVCRKCNRCIYSDTGVDEYAFR